MVSVTLLQRGPTSFRVRTRWKDENTGEVKETNTTVRGTRAHAEAHKKLILDGFHSGYMTKMDTGTVADFLRDWLKKREAFNEIRGSTSSTYEKMFRLFTSRFGDSPLATLGVEPVRQWVLDTLIAKGPKSTNYTCKILKQAFKAAVKEGKAPFNVFDRVDIPQAPSASKEGTIGSDKLKALWEWSGEQDTLTRLAARLALETGLRRGELAGLQWADISATGVVSVRRTIVVVRRKIVAQPPKSKKGARKIMISSELRDELNALRPKNDELYVLGGGACPLQPEAVSRTLGRALRAVGLTDFTAHDFRHAHATHLLKKGIPISAVSRRLGHAKVTTTMNVYAHALPEDEDEIVGAVDTMLRFKKEDDE